MNILISALIAFVLSFVIVQVPYLFGGMELIKNTPDLKLADYARRYKRDPNRWFFLTGEQSALHDVSLNGFHLQSIDGSTTHSTRYALVDRSGKLVFAMPGSTAAVELAMMKLILPELKHLLRELHK